MSTTTRTERNRLRRLHSRVHAKTLDVFMRDHRLGTPSYPHWSYDFDAGELQQFYQRMVTLVDPRTDVLVPEREKIEVFLNAPQLKGTLQCQNCGEYNESVKECPKLEPAMRFLCWECRKAYIVALDRLKK